MTIIARDVVAQNLNCDLRFVVWCGVDPHAVAAREVAESSRDVDAVAISRTILTKPIAQRVHAAYSQHVTSQVNSIK